MTMAPVELRCDMRLHGILTDDGLIEISCRSALCGHKDGVVVIHRFDCLTGEFKGTQMYRDTPVINQNKEA